jgi:hypothetical protein
MGRPKKAPIEELLPVEDAQTEEEIVIDDFFTDVAPHTAYIEVFRIRDDGRRPQLGRFTLDLLREDCHGFLREKFGNGRYMLVSKTRENRFYRSKTLDVDSERPAAIPPQAPVKDNFEREMLLALIAAQKPLDVGTLLQGLAAMRPPSPPDPSTLLTAMVTAIATLKGPSNGEDSNLERALKLIGAAKELAPPAHEENLYTVVKEVGNKVVDAFSPRKPAAVMIPEQTGQPEQQSTAPSLDEETMQQKWLQAQLGYLKAKARNGKDPVYFANYILDNDDEPGNNAILTALERGASFEHLCQFDSEIASNPVLNTWFRSLYDALQQAMSAPVEPEAPVDTGRPGGNTPDPVPDAKPSMGTVPESPTSGIPASKSRKR